MLIACQEKWEPLNAVEDTVNTLDKFLCPACLERRSVLKRKSHATTFCSYFFKRLSFYTENEGAEHPEFESFLWLLGPESLIMQFKWKRIYLNCNKLQICW